jgi:cytochrome c oxidase subunit III
MFPRLNRFTPGYQKRVRPVALRAHPLVFGVALFLASELMFFAGFFAAYFDLRSGSVAWPPPGVHLDTGLAALGTVLLAVSSGAAIGTTRALAANRSAYGWLFLGIAAAIAFVAIALAGYQNDAFTIASNAYGSLYFSMTGFHLIHVAAGVVLLTALLWGLRSPAITANHRAAAEAIMYYWHFVFVVWLGIFGTIYLVR